MRDNPKPMHGGEAAAQAASMDVPSLSRLRPEPASLEHLPRTGHSRWGQRLGAGASAVGSLRLASKLFLSLAAMCLLVTLTTVAVARYSFTQGFLRYLNEESFEQLDRMVPRFEAAYAAHGSWAFMINDGRVFFEVVQPSLVDTGPTLVHPRRPPTVVLTGIDKRITVLDTGGQRIAGSPEVTPQTPRRPILFNGNVVGYLSVLPFETVTGPADVRFQQRQYEGIWIISTSFLILAAIAAILLARSLTNPLQRIAYAMHRLASGRYSERLHFTSTDEIGKLGEDFNHLARALERTEQMRRTFMADVSHELRTPLTAMNSLVEAIEDGLRALTPQTLLTFKTEITVMNKLVSDLYDLSLSDAGALAYRKSSVDVAGALAVTLQAFHSRLHERRLHLDAVVPEQPLLIEADESRLHQLFANVLENAVRYTDPEGALRVSLSTHGQDVVIDFEDSKPGVPDADLPHLFERFFRVERSRNRATGGAGLGLAICSNIVQAHAGSISAQPSGLGGLWIRITLPM